MSAGCCSIHPSFLSFFFKLIFSLSFSLFVCFFFFWFSKWERDGSQECTLARAFQCVCKRPIPHRARGRCLIHLVFAALVPFRCLTRQCILDREYNALLFLWKEGTGKERKKAPTNHHLMHALEAETCINKRRLFPFSSNRSCI